MLHILSTTADGRNILFKTKDNQYLLSSNKSPPPDSIKETNEQKVKIIKEAKQLIQQSSKSDSNDHETESESDNFAEYLAMKVVKRLNDKDFLFIPRPSDNWGPYAWFKAEMKMREQAKRRAEMKRKDLIGKHITEEQNEVELTTEHLEKVGYTGYPRKNAPMFKDFPKLGSNFCDTQYISNCY